MRVSHASVEDTILKGTELIIADFFSLDQFSSCCERASEPELEPVFAFQDFVCWTSISRAAVFFGYFDFSCCDAGGTVRGPFSSCLPFCKPALQISSLEARSFNQFQVFQDSLIYSSFVRASQQVLRRMNKTLFSAVGL